MTPDQSICYLEGVIDNYLPINTPYRESAYRVTSSPAWQSCSGSLAGTHKHHSFRGGVAVHTAEVMAAALGMAEAIQNDMDNPVDLKVIVMAVLWHDYAKIYDYNLDGTAKEHRYKIRHVARSYAEWERFAAPLEFDDPTFVESVGHCILAHHGRLEWGSPVEPQTLEAHIVHSADLASSWFMKHATVDRAAKG